MEKNECKISIISYVKESKHVFYILEILFNNNKYIIKERYSNLHKLNNNLISEFKKNKNISHLKFPSFPPKKFLNNTSDEISIQRQKELNIYFSEICKNEDFVNLNSLKLFINNCIKNYEKENFNIEKTKTIKKFDEKNAKLIVDDTKQKFIYIDNKKSNLKTNNKYNNILKEILNPYCFDFTISTGDKNNFKLLEENNINEENKINDVEINLKNKINSINNFNYNEVNNIIISYKL